MGKLIKTILIYSFFIPFFIFLVFIIIAPRTYALTTYFQDNFSNSINGQPLVQVDPLDYSSSTGFFYDIPDFIYDATKGVWSNGNFAAGDVLKYSSINHSYYCAGFTLVRDNSDNRTYPAITMNTTNQNDGYIFNFDLNWDTGLIQQSSIYTPSKGYLYYSTTIHFNNTVNQHWIQACNNTGTLTMYLDGNELATTEDNSFNAGNVNFSLYYAPHSHITNWAVADSPNNPSYDLAVPLFKQTDPTWGSQEYDSGNLWAPGHGTIGGFGCAMTSAAMVFKYYGITKLPDNTDLDPGTLNTWLKNQADGYVGEGLLNWLALTRLSKISKLNNSSFLYDGLEFSRAGSDKTILTTDINNNQPDILEEPGHFIVGKRINGTTFDINDPYYNRTDLNNTGYNNSFLSLERFIPSHTDLSYIMLTVDPSITLTVKTSSGSAVGTQFIQQPLGDAINNGTPSGKALKIVYLPKPNTGTYNITLFGNNIQQYHLGVYLYDSTGNVTPITSTGTVGGNTPEIFSLVYNSQSLNTSSLSRIITFQSFINDVNENIALNQINKNLGIPLITVINSAKDSADKGQKLAEKVKLDAIELALKALHGKGISDSAYHILYYDAEYLKNHL